MSAFLVIGLLRQRPESCRKQTLESHHNPESLLPSLPFIQAEATRTNVSPLDICEM